MIKHEKEMRYSNLHMNIFNLHSTRATEDHIFTSHVHECIRSLAQATNALHIFFISFYFSLHLFDM